MEKARIAGYNTYQLYNASCPEEYKDKPHLKTAWEAGLKQAKSETQYSW